MPTPLEPTLPRARPFLKWVGGKATLVPQITQHFPTHIESYFEPFLGGGAVFFSLAGAGRITNGYLSDWNAELVNAYEVLGDLDDYGHLPQVMERLRSLRYDPTVFAEVRARDTSTMSKIDWAVRMIYLNKTCFNGLYRVNKKGQFNAPFGRYTNPTICDVDNLTAVQRTLRSLPGTLDIMQGDFELNLEQAVRGDVVYFDPPYVPVSTTSDFTSYTADGFGSVDQVRLRDAIKKLAGRGVTVVASNSDCPATRDLYQGFTIHSVKARRSINTKSTGRGPVGEILVVANSQAGV